MIITTATQIPDTDLERFGWVGLRRFHNVEAVQILISDLHKVPRNNPNVKKQATQIRYCLQQAREYFDAAKAVSLATKPALLYYSIMNLALAELLLKQDGDSSLDRAREQHRHHGLTFEFGNQGRQALTLANHASSLRARPAIRPVNGTLERFGTFELWHRSCRALPLAGILTDYSHNVSLTTFHTILTQDDKRLQLLPDSGITLLECLSSLPGMSHFLYSYGITPDMVRAKVTATLDATGMQTTQITVQPSDQEKVNEFFANMTFNANNADIIQMQELPNGGLITLSGNYGHCEIPPGLALNANNLYFLPRWGPLNEFGMMYVALYICGNYARYYPDFWIRDVETHSALALAVDELIHVAENAMALLTLSELSRTYFVPEA
jgi:YaaC-like Protein